MRKTDQQSDRHMTWKEIRERKRGRQTDGERQADSKTEGQTDRHMHTQMETETIDTERHEQTRKGRWGEGGKRKTKRGGEGYKERKICT